MLTITVRWGETFDEESNKFDYTDKVTLELEHSLISLSKWEAKWQKPFLAPGEKSPEEIIGYIEAMVLSPEVSPEVLHYLSEKNLSEINAYIESTQSATTFPNEHKNTRRNETITSELIYYWMGGFSIPFECETWHLNRLFSLIRVHNVKNSKPKKMSRSELSAQRRSLNAQRKSQSGSTG